MLRTRGLYIWGKTNMKTRAKLNVQFQIDLTLVELLALDALVGYGTDEFIEKFYVHLGKAYMQQHESGLRAIFAKIDTLRPALAEIKKVKEAAAEAEKQYRS